MYVSFIILFVTNICKPDVLKKIHLLSFTSFQKSSNVSLSRIIDRRITKTAFIWTSITHLDYNYSSLDLFIRYLFLYVLHIYSSIYYIFIYPFPTIDRHKKCRDNRSSINI